MALSGWQTVLITLGASAVTGTAALLVSWLSGNQESSRLDRQLDHEREQQAERIQHERDEQWRDRLTDAAADFSTGVQQALLGVHEAIQVAAAPSKIESESNRREREQAAIAKADRMIGEAIPRVARVSLVFGEESDATGLAEEVIRQLETTLNQVKPPARNVSAGWEAIGETYDLQKRFNRAARDAIRQQPLENGGLENLR